MTPIPRKRRGRIRRLLPAVLAAATLAATIPVAAPAHARPPSASGPPNRVALVERVNPVRWVP
jgi:hypothetical protein